VIQYLPNPLTIPVGVVIGILVAAPVGPVNVLCIQRAIARGAMGGLAAGLGAMLGDGIIAFAAAMGVGALPSAVTDYRDVIQAVGGLALIAFGLKLSFSRPRLSPDVADGNEWATLVDYLWDIPKTFLLTITNPGAVLGLAAIFGGVSSFVEIETTVDALTMVAAVMAGSLAWWLFLSFLVSRIRDRIDLTRLKQINMIAGALLVGFGLIVVGEIVWKLVR
jgi:threonine/homoserine/homoserine lactone efflux protein